MTVIRSQPATARPDEPAAPGKVAPPAHLVPHRPARLRLNDFYEITGPADPRAAAAEAERCMGCGAAFCMPDSGYGAGCPIHNKIPEWNALVRLGRWREAYDRLSETNPFPEFTSRICPAPCEDACIHGINDEPIQIKGIERAIIDRAFDEGWVRPRRPARRTGRAVAVVGSGPAGLAAADRLNQRGHYVCVFERSDRAGGLLCDGVPAMKLDKQVVQRRVQLLAAEGIRFRLEHEVGVDVTVEHLRQHYDAVLLACGALRPRELDLPGRTLEGVHQAMTYLRQATARANGATARPASTTGPTPAIDVRGCDVVIIGGGDTGADCIATALRQGCRSLVNITRRAKPPAERDAGHPWPEPAGTYTLDYAHREGVARFGRDPRSFEVEPVAFVPDAAGRRVAAVRVRRLDTGAVETLPAQRVILAVGFTGHDVPGLVQQLGVTDDGGAIVAEGHRTAHRGIYAAGDCRRGPSLVVWAIREGRDAADAIHADLLADATA